MKRSRKQPQEAQETRKRKTVIAVLGELKSNYEDTVTWAIDEASGELGFGLRALAITDGDDYVKSVVLDVGYDDTLDVVKPMARIAQYFD